jgi:hypothetical protein
MPLIEGNKMNRAKPIGFLYSERMSYSNERYKIVSYAGQPFELYDIQKDAAEKVNIAEQHPEILSGLQQEFTAWMKSVKGSFDGGEYGTKSLERSELKWKLPADGVPGKKRKTNQ